MEDALPGRPSPLGATPRDGGINFAVASSVAEAAEVCLFDEAGHETRFRRHRYLTGVEAAELGWFTPAGTPMTEECWNDPEALALGVYLDGSDAPDTGPDGQPLLDDDFLVLVNGWWQRLEFTIGDCRPGLAWRAEIDTFDPAVTQPAPILKAGDRVTVGPRSVLVLRGPRADG